SRKFGRIHPQTHGIALGSPYLHVGDPRYGLKALLEYAIGDFGKLERIARVASHAQEHDGAGVGVSLGYDGVIGLRRQAASCTAHTVAHVVGGRLERNFEVELDGDGAGTLTAHRCDAADTGDAVDALFERLRDLRLHNVGVCARVGGGHSDDGRI